MWCPGQEPRPLEPSNHPWGCWLRLWREIGEREASAPARRNPYFAPGAKRTLPRQTSATNGGRRGAVFPSLLAHPLALSRRIARPIFLFSTAKNRLLDRSVRRSARLLLPGGGGGEYGDIIETRHRMIGETVIDLSIYLLVHVGARREEGGGGTSSDEDGSLCSSSAQEHGGGRHCRCHKIPKRSKPNRHYG